MNIYLGMHGVLIRTDEIPGCVAVWCPELDIMTQGFGAEDACFMMYDAARAIIQDDLSATITGVDEEGNWNQIRKRVQHPYRRAFVPKESAEREEYELTWERYMRHLPPSRRYRSSDLFSLPHDSLAFIDADEFDRDGYEVGFFAFNLGIVSGRGHVFMNGPEPYSTLPQIRVPAAQIVVKYEETFERETTICIGANSIGDDPQAAMNKTISDFAAAQGFGHRGQRIKLTGAKLQQQQTRKASK